MQNSMQRESTIQPAAQYKIAAELESLRRVILNFVQASISGCWVVSEFSLLSLDFPSIYIIFPFQSCLPLSLYGLCFSSIHLSLFSSFDPASHSSWLLFPCLKPLLLIL